MRHDNPADVYRQARAILRLARHATSPAQVRAALQLVALRRDQIAELRTGRRESWHTAYVVGAPKTRG